MLNIIGSVFRYSCLVIVVLVLSHIVEVKGTTISQHVENSMNWLGDLNPKKQYRRFISKTLSLQSDEPSRFRVSTPQVSIDSDSTSVDEKSLSRIIEHAKQR